MSVWNALTDPTTLLACKALCPKFNTLPEFWAITSCVTVNLSVNVGLIVFAIGFYDPDIFILMLNICAFTTYLFANALAELYAEMPPYPECNASWNLPCPTLVVIVFYYGFFLTTNVIFGVKMKLYRVIMLTLAMIAVDASWLVLGMVDIVSVYYSFLLRVFDLFLSLPSLRTHTQY